MVKKKVEDKIKQKVDPLRARDKDLIPDRIKKGDAAAVNCICPNCGTRMPNQAGIPCDLIMCPKCGTAMRKE